MVVGVLIGMAIGVSSHKDDWAGGYPSYRRRMMRLSHIAAFALGMINVLFAVGFQFMIAAAISEGEQLGILTNLYDPARIALASGGILMPIVCLLAAWKKECRHLFPLPACCLLFGIGYQCLWAWSLVF